MGCDVLDRVENRGIEIGRKEGREEGRKEGREEGRKEGRKEGKTEGEDNIRLLSQKLFSQDRIEDVKRVMEDKDYCDQLKKEFGIC